MGTQLSVPNKFIVPALRCKSYAPFDTAPFMQARPT